MTMFRLLPLLLLSCSALAQSTSLDYYLPGTNYDSAVPTPDEVLGFQIGDWHLSHDQLVFYMRTLAAASDRISIEETGRTYEDRPLLLLVISSPKNLRNVENIREAHLRRARASTPTPVRATDPVVVYQGFSIHGNESSGSNAAPLLAYHLAASNDAEVERLLDQTVILLDPSLNPDGLQRFSTWANAHKSLTPVTDPQSREFNEAWPRGRTNHYWFDLNRDWLPAQHPESRARIATYHRWLPNVLTDHHEMGSDRSFFFQPGIATRTNPLTPARNQELTAALGNYHARALDAIGSLYYSGESFDDFYYGKGSTYPDINGGVGILFEQASSRGHARNTENGVLTFPFTIRNQLTAALSTLRGAQALREELLTYQTDFYASARREAAAASQRAYLFTAPGDPARVAAFAELLRLHELRAFRLTEDYRTAGRRYAADNTLLVPVDQPNYRLLRTMVEPQTVFRDSLFYDVSAWSLPHAFGLQTDVLDERTLLTLRGAPVLESGPETVVPPVYSNYAYLIDWRSYDAPRLVYALLRNGLRLRVATESFRLNAVDYPAGTVLVQVQGQNYTAAQLHQRLLELQSGTGVRIDGVATGLTNAGIDLGSPSFVSFRRPKVALLVGDGVRSYDAGEVWHLLDQRYGIPVTTLPTTRVGRSDLDGYTHLVMSSGNYASLGQSGNAKITNWVKGGGTLLTVRDAVRWADQQGLVSVDFKKMDSPKKGVRRPYAERARDSGAAVVGGAIFRATLDLTHPLAYGYTDPMISLFRNTTLFVAPTENPYATPAVYTDAPLIAGYISPTNLDSLANTAAITTHRSGSGRVICYLDNPNFRAFWYGTNRLFINGLFFGNTLNRGSLAN